MSVDPCALLVANLTGGVFISNIAQVEACYNSFPVTRADKQEQIDTVKSYFNLYPYKDIVQNVEEPYYPMEVNMFKELDRITTNDNIKTEYQMQNAIIDTLAKLEDGHVAYMPLCFQSFRFLQPFHLAPKFTDHGPRFYVDSLTVPADSPLHAPVYNTWAKAFKGARPEEFLGASINTINGQDPTEFLQKFVDTNNGIGHAPETRFNTALLSYNWPLTNISYFYSFSVQRRPRRPITYEFQFANKTVKEITFQWPARLRTNPKNFESAATYYQSECTPPPPVPAQAAAVTLENRLIDPVRPTLSKIDKNSTSISDISGATLLTSDDYGAYFMLSDKKTGVWMMPTFFPDVIESMPDFTAGVQEWFKNMTSGLAVLEQNGAQRLIIDVTNNGGGLICAGWRMANFLFPKSNLRPLQYQVRMTQSLADAALASPEIAEYIFVGGLNVNGTKMTNYTSQGILPGEKIKGYRHLNSNRFLFNFDAPDSGCPMIPQTDNLKKGWAPKDIIIVSNGLCGSTCAQFTTLLRDQVGVRTATYGGGYKRSAGDSNFDPTAFAAGMILPFKSILNIFEYAQEVDPTAFTSHKLKLSGQDKEDTMVPRPFKFPIHPGSQMPFLTSYSPKPKLANLPVEWIVDKSEFFLRDVNMADPATIYKAILGRKLFESRIPANSQKKN
ncbi:UNVERIFIED_CONTAM: hypothetical protein HDU68_001395 [Siphonaria sp. JEL0065]|nr:hypothetical protein HDU68_001395 [Siphonaria sp. JEL0065]